MYRVYLVIGALALSMFTYAQYQNWSLYGNDAQREARVPGRSGSLYSGHK